MMSLKRVCGFFPFFLHGFGTAAQKCEAVCLRAAQISPLSLSSLCCSFPCSIGIPPDSSPEGWHSAISSQK